MTNDTPLRRKLAAILAADVVGYSKKMGESEARTLRNLKLCRAITDKSIHDHHGRIFHTAGDSVIAEFASPLDAVNAAIEFQRALQKRNASCDPADQLELRVGVNLGDIIVEGENLYGEGINIAARIESIAVPGGICVAQSVFSVVRKNINGIEFTSRGLQTLKNIDEPVEVFDLRDGQSASSVIEPSSGPSTGAAASPNPKPVVLIEPIRALGGDERIAVFATGLLDGIVSSLMRSSAFLVVKQSANKQAEPPMQAGVQGQIRFKVTGSIQAVGSKLRIFVNLENAISGAQIWSNRFDKTSDDIFELQDEIVQKVNLDIRHKIKEANFQCLEAMPNSALSVAELLDKAAGLFVRDGKRSVLKAEPCIELALEREPRNSMAMSMKAHCIDWIFDKSPYPVEGAAAQAHLHLIDSAIQLDARNYYALSLRAEQQFHCGAFKECIRTADVALRIFPDFDQAKSIRALADFHITGDVRPLESSAKRVRYFFLHDAVLAWFAADLGERAVEDAELVFERMAGFAFSEVCALVVMCEYRTGGLHQAKVASLLSRYPDLNYENCRKPLFGNPKAAERFSAGLQNLLSSRA
jgi:adenylate cyclase